LIINCLLLQALVWICFIKPSLLLMLLIKPSLLLMYGLFGQKLKYASHQRQSAKLHYSNCIRISEYFRQIFGG